MIPFVSNLLLLMIPVIIFGIAHGTCSPSIQVLLAGLAPLKYRAAFISLNGMFLRLGQTFGPLLMDLIYSIWGNCLISCGINSKRETLNKPLLGLRGYRGRVPV